jgi:hypothetical protein
MNKKNITIIAASLLLIVVVLLLPITVSMSVEVPCKISPAYKWFVQLGNDGNILTSLHNAQSGSIENYFSSVPERGDSYAFNLVRDPSSSWVEEGDTIGIIQSNLFSQEYAALKGRLETSKANLNILLTGEKESLVQQAREQLNAAIENAQYLKKLYELKNDLFKKGLLSFEENELYRSQARQAEIDVAVKQAYLESIQTGSKQEQINLVRNEIKSIQQELQVLNEKKKSYIITSPIRGTINSFNSSDTILTVNSPKSILFIPVAWKYQHLIIRGQQVELKDATGQNVSFTVSKISSAIKHFNGEQVLTIVATSEQIDLGFPDNLWTSCVLSLGDVSLFDFLKWKLSQTYEV